MSSAPFPCPELADVRFYLLNVDGRADRLKRMEALLSEEQPWMCGKTCRVPGPDGNAFGKLMNENLVDRGLWASAVGRSTTEQQTLGASQMTKGRVGMSLGHALIWDQIRKQQEPWAVVMEDDLAYFNPKYGQTLCHIAKEKISNGEPQFDMVRLTNCKKKNCEKTDVIDVVQEPNEFCLGAYAMTKASASKAIDGMFPIRGPRIDSWLYREFPDAYTTSPCVVQQIPGEYDDRDAKILYDIETPSASFMEGADGACKIPICASGFGMDRLVEAGEKNRANDAWHQQLYIGTAFVLCVVGILSYSYWTPALRKGARGWSSF
jgi:GR25 family glycosyltransferase involved in LPS biosynthesis